MRNPASHRLDVTIVTDRDEVAAAFGTVAAWRANILKLTAKEAKEKHPQRKRYLRLMLLNAYTQLDVALNAAEQ